jgi:deazaflavin-dependent oxidoreductase (nitroreductase family)
MAGKIKAIRPNLMHRLLHVVVSIRPLVPFFASNMHRLDLYFLKLTGGKYSLAELAGWTIIQLTTVGAKTGKERTIPLLAGIEDDKIALIASSYGRERNPGWYYNLKTNPECKVAFKGISLPYVAREVHGDEYDKYWNLVASNYVGYEKYKKYAAHRHIPVMVLELKE